MPKFEYKYLTPNEFFVGNLNKTKTRDEIFQELTQIEIERLDGEKLYIKKFNMPKFNARRNSEGDLLLNLGYAFVTASKPEMAEELIERGRMKMEDGTDLEFKPINRNKRLVANQKCKEKNLSKYNNVDSNVKNSDNDKNWRNFADNNNNFGGDFGLNHENKPEVGDLLWQPYQYKCNGNSSSSSKPITSIFDQVVKENSDSDGLHDS
jgi:hypothetical protein